MKTTEYPVKTMQCGRYKYTHFKGKKVFCKGNVNLYPSLAENFIQGTCDTCGWITGEKVK